MLTVKVDFDLLFLNNFLLTYVTFLLVTILLGRQIRWLRLFIVSALSTILMIFLFLKPGWHPLYISLIHFLMTFIMFKYLYHPITLRENFQALLLAYLIGAMEAGLSTLVLSAVRGPLEFWLEDKLGLESLSIYYLLITLFFILFAGWKVVNWVQDNLLKKSRITDLKVGLNNREVTICGLWDTGNQLRDPLTGFPVVVVEDKAVEDLFTVKPDWTMEDIYSIQEQVGTKFRLIPFSGIGDGGGRLLPGFKPDYVEVLEEEGNALKTEQVIISISYTRLDPDYQALIPPALKLNREG